MYKKKLLKNKLETVVSSMPHMESIAMGIWIGTGSRYEERRICGVSHFIEHMLFKGTLTRSASQLKQAIEGIGGHFNGFTSEEVTCYLVKVPAQHLLLGFDILSDMILNPRMDEEEVKKEKEVICEEIKMYKDQPSSFVHEILAGLMWPGHPLGRSIAGVTDSVRRINRKILTEYKEKSYMPQNIAVVAAGRLNMHRFLDNVRKKFKNEPRNVSKTNPAFKRFRTAQKAKRIKLHFKDIEQTHIAIGFHSFGRNDKDKYALNLLNVILGGNMSSRLFERLREKQALCYDVSSSTKKYEETGAFLIHAGVDNNKSEEALRAIMEETANLKKYYVTEDELERAKEYYKGQLLLALEDTGSRMLWLGDKIMTKEGIPLIKTILDRIDGVTVEGIQKVAKRVFRNDIMNLAAIGPAQSLKEKKISSIMEV